jgi:gluconolactonase
MLIANFAGHQLQSLDLSSGEVTTLCDEVAGRPLRCANYPIVSRDGTIYCSSSTQSGEYLSALVSGAADGFIARIPASGSADIVADGIIFPNALALDADERYLYCVRTSPGDVVRFPILPDGRLGDEEPYGPPMGDRSEYGEVAVRAVWGDQEEQSYATADLGILFRWGCTDGCAFDAEGNLWVTIPGIGRIVAITPDESVVVVVDDPEMKVLLSPTSVNFGGLDMRDVYIGSLFAPYVVRARSSVPGLPLAAQR